MTDTAARHRDQVVPVSARALADSVRVGRESAAGITRQYLARIERLDPRLRAFAHVRADQAVEV